MTGLLRHVRRGNRAVLTSPHRPGRRAGDHRRRGRSHHRPAPGGGTGVRVGRGDLHPGRVSRCAAPAAAAGHLAPAASSRDTAPAAVAAPRPPHGTRPSRPGPPRPRSPGPPSGWSTVFSDDFNGAAGSGPSSAWKYDTGPGSSFGTGEIETMTNSTSNVHLDGNGDLDITALDQGSSWTSGRIQTTSANVGAPAGGELEVTASIQQPDLAALGYWPAFWMLGPGQWPENGEIDIMEDVNSLSELSGTVHCGTDPGGPCNEPNGIGSGLSPAPAARPATTPTR